MSSLVGLRQSRKDLILVACSVLQGAALLLVPSLLLVAVGLWWSSNTVAHCFLHRPFFRSPQVNRLFALYQTALLGVPQTLWRERHLAHHADRPWRFHWSGPLALELLVIACVWTSLAALAPRFLLLEYFPGYALGLLLCAIHGHQEHARGTTSHHGTVYNLLFFNDGYHVEHHSHPGLHWSQLAGARAGEGRVSRWPPILRWLESFSLDGLERLVLRSPRLQRLVLNAHERTFRKLLPAVGRVERAAIVGGGLYPRTAIVLSRLLPNAELTLIDLSSRNLETARELLAEKAVVVDVIHGRFDPGRHGGFDLVVVPLAYRGEREAVYTQIAGPVIVHDWIWRPRGTSRVVAPWLLKRLNLVQGRGVPCTA